MGAVTLEAAPNPTYCFAALKLIEQLYKDGELPVHIFRNILKEYADVVDLSKFSLVDEEVAA